MSPSRTTPVSPAFGPAMNFFPLNRSVTARRTRIEAAFSLRSSGARRNSSTRKTLAAVTGSSTTVTSPVASEYL